MEQFGPYLFGAFFIFVLGTFAYRIFRYKSIRGMFFGAPVLSTVGEVECEKQGPVRLVIRVHKLGENEMHEHGVGIELVGKSFASYDMMPATLSASQAKALAGLLERAASGDDAL
jgi:hypothetical protein